MDFTLSYAAFIGGVLVFFTCGQIAILLAAKCRDEFRSRIEYPLLSWRRRYIDSVTRLDAIWLALYVGLNGVVIGFAAVDGKEKLTERAAFTSLVNLVPLFLGGKTNPLMSFVGLPLATYRLAHYSFGWVAIAEALLHAGLSLAQGKLAGFMSISGFIASITLTLIFIWSLWLLGGRSHSAILFFAHRLLALSTLGAITWHALVMRQLLPKILVGCACGLWIGTTSLRLLRALYHGQAIVNVWQDDQVVRGRAQLRRPIKLFPGCYFYLYFLNAPVHAKFQGRAVTTAWWKDSQGSDYSSELTFLLTRQGSIASIAKNDKSLQRLYLDGPYGHDLRLHEFENVFLAAKGIGIAGILPYALHLAQRQRFDELLMFRKTQSREISPKEALFKDTTRRVDLFWVLENNSQLKWLREEFQRLLCVWCFCPSPINPKLQAPFEDKDNNYWKCIEPQPGFDLYENGIFREIAKGTSSPGRIIVVSCGDATFTGQIRNVAIRDASMQFAEVEFRPTYPEQDSSGRPRTASRKRLRRLPPQVSDPESLALASNEGYEF